MSGHQQDERGGLPNNKEILAELITKADLDETHKEVKECLRAYKLEATEKALHNAIKKFTRDTILKTLLFLNVNGTSVSNMNKPDMAKELICRVQNFLVDNCGECGNDFATTIEEPLLLQCELCGQNMHIDCLKKKLLGNHYHEGITCEQVKSLIDPFGLKVVSLFVQ